MYGGATLEHWDTDTWEWNGSRWIRLSVPGPGPRAAFRMVYDSHRRVVVLLGGIGPPRTDGQPQEYLNDTWLWDGTAWRRARVEGPAGRRDYSMAFDSRRGIVLLYGGAAGGGPTTQRFADLWEWNGTTWKDIPQRTPTPGHRYVSAMAYDAARDRTVLYGGYGCVDANQQCDVFGDTWDYLFNGVSQGTAWSQPGFDASAWPAGTSELGIGDNDESTIIGPITTPTPITAYFRRTFEITDLSTVTALTMDVVRDDFRRSPDLADPPQHKGKSAAGDESPQAGQGIWPATRKRAAYKGLLIDSGLSH